MSEVNFDKFKCRCSAITKMMANSRDNPVLTALQAQKLAKYEASTSLADSQKVEMAELLVRKENGQKIVLSDGCIEYLMEWYAWAVEGMIPVDREAMDIEYTRKGKSTENDCINLLSRVDKQLYTKNDIRISNDYFTGEPDIFVGEEIMKATKITDNKSIWDYPGFLKAIHKKPENNYIEQVQGYMEISGAKVGEIAKTLVSMPVEIMYDYQNRLLKKMNAISTESPDFLEEWAKWEHSMLFEHIPIHKRVFKIPVQPFAAERKQQLQDRVKICREWLWKFDEMYNQMNK